MTGSPAETGFQLSPRQRTLHSRPGTKTLFLEAGGSLSGEKLLLLLNRIRTRHEILRTRIGILPGRRASCQIIEPNGTGGAHDHFLKASSNPTHPGDLGKAGSFKPEILPSWRVATGPGETVTHLALSLGGLTGDWTSLSILMKELAHAARETESHDEDPFQYADYAAWQQECFENPSTAKPSVESPPFFPEHAGTGHAWLECGDLGTISGLTDEKLLEPVCLSACHALAGRFSGLQEPLLGVVLDGRRESELAGMIGPTEKVFPFRSGLDLTFGDLAHAASDWLEDTSASFDSTFPQWEREPDVSFQFIRFPEQVEGPGWQLHPAGVFESPDGRHRLSVVAVLRGKALAVHVAANTGIASLSPKATALFFAEQFRHFLKTARAESPVFSIPLHRSMGSPPDTACPVPAPAVVPVTEMVKACRERRPDAIALSDQDRDWTYSEFWNTSNLIAQTLLAQGLNPGDRVAVLGEKNFGMISSLFGTLLAGGVIVPLDHALPQARMADMACMAKARFLLAVGAGPLPTGLSAEILRIGTDGKPSPGAIPDPDPPPEELPAPDINAPAYVLFTSGTTGSPKGVLGRHRGLSHFIGWQGKEYQITPADRVAQLTAFSFDVFLREVFLPLCHGATLCLPPENVLGVPSVAVDWLAGSRISILHLVPSIADWWLGAGGSDGARDGENSLRAVFFAGEPLLGSLVERWRARFGKKAVLVNLYGPTETTLAKCHYRIPEEAGNGVQPIGYPLPGAQIFVRNAKGADCVPGEPGEILIRTPFHAEPLDPDGTGFFRNPSGMDPLDLFYRSGDMGRFRGDGALEIAGRSDDQVKIRGVRISPLEIESALSRFPGVERSAVLAVGDNPAQKILVAFVSSDPDSRLDTEALLAGLRRQLPAAMIPSRIEAITRFPLTPHGKMDRRALLEAAQKPAKEPKKNNISPPSNEQQRLMLEVWKELFQREDIGITDHFFELGGHSLIAARLAARLRELTGNDVPLHWIFEEPTVESLSARLGTGAASTPDARGIPSPLPEGASAPLSHSQLRIWLHDRLEPEAVSYNIPVSARLSGPLDEARLRRSIQQVIRRHSMLRTVFSDENGLPTQHAEKDWELPLRSIDLGREPFELRAKKLEALALAEARQPFRPEEAPPIRALLARTAENEHTLLITLHHLAGDGWSSVLFLRELENFYHEKIPPALPFQYADFAAWDRSGKNTVLHSEGLGYWAKRLAMPATENIFPTDFPRPHSGSPAGETVTIQLDARLAEGLRSLASRENATLFITLLAAFSSFLGRLTGREEIVLGTPVANRPLRESEALIGCFINTLPMKVCLSKQEKFVDLLRRVRAGVLEDFRHQQIPFEEIVRVARPVRHANIHPLFQVLFNVLNFEPGQPSISELRFERIFPAAPGSKFDWTVYVRDGSHLEIQFLYDRRLFDRERMETRAGVFRSFLSGLMAAPTESSSSFNIPPEALFSGTGDPQDHPSTTGSAEKSGGEGDRENDTVIQAVKSAWLRHLPPDSLRDEETNFFEAGGHSLMAMEIAHALGKKLGLHVPLRMFLTYPTIRSLSGELARTIDSGNAAGQKDAEWKL